MHGVRVTSNIPRTSLIIFPRSAYLPQGWTRLVNPEGARYYVNNTEAICIVTDAPLHRQEIYEKLYASVERILYQIKVLKFQVPADCEIYVRPHSNREGCVYYMIDHDSHTEFWLQSIHSDALEMPAVSSIDHLSKLQKIFRKWHN